MPKLTSGGQFEGGHRDPICKGFCVCHYPVSFALLATCSAFKHAVPRLWKLEEKLIDEKLL